MSVIFCKTIKTFKNAKHVYYILIYPPLGLELFNQKKLNSSITNTQENKAKVHAIREEFAIRITEQKILTTIDSRRESLYS